MPRFLTGTSQKGLIKSMQHITSSSVNDSTSDITITAVVINSSVIIPNGQFSSFAGASANDQSTYSGGSSSPCTAEFTSTTNVRITATDRDMFGANYDSKAATFYGTVIEYDL